MSERASRDAAAPEALAVRVHGTEFGLPVEQVREVVDVPPITRLPVPGPAVCGVCSLRGEILPVLDLGVRLFGRETEQPGRMAVVEHEAAHGALGLLMESVAGLVAVPDERQAVPPEVEASLPPGWIAGVFAPEPGRLVTLLNLAPVLALAEPNSEPHA